jgi:hypothetical protein
MQHLTQDEFLELYPQFAQCPQVWLDAIFEQMPCAFNRCVWGCQLKQGEAYYVAHYLTMRELALQLGGYDPDNPDAEVDLISGVIQTSVTEFDAGSVSYKKDFNVDEALIASPYSRTVWGQMYDALRKSVAVGLVMVT